MAFKRFQKVRVKCDIEGKVINTLPPIARIEHGGKEQVGYRVSVQLPGHKSKWWIIIPEEFVEEYNENT